MAMMPEFYVKVDGLFQPISMTEVIPLDNENPVLVILGIGSRKHPATEEEITSLTYALGEQLPSNYMLMGITPGLASLHVINMIGMRDGRVMVIEVAPGKKDEIEGLLKQLEDPRIKVGETVLVVEKAAVSVTVGNP